MNKREPKKPLSLRPLKIEQALRAAMETGPPPELPKKGKKEKPITPKG